MAQNTKWEKLLGRTIIGMIITFILIISTLTAYNMVGPSYTYRKEIRGHMENAYYANSPELMKEELSLAIEGMEKLGLTEDMYGAFWQWDKTPDKRMSYQYDHLQGILERIDAVIVWRDTTYGNQSTSTEQLGDVYEQKMDNLRAFLKEDGWSDWIAEDAYYVNNHLWLHLAPLWLGVLAISFILIVLWCVIRLGRLGASYHEDEDEDEYTPPEMPGYED